TGFPPATPSQAEPERDAFDSTILVDQVPEPSALGACRYITNEKGLLKKSWPEHAKRIPGFPSGMTASATDRTLLVPLGGVPTSVAVQVPEPSAALFRAKVIAVLLPYAAAGAPAIDASDAGEVTEIARGLVVHTPLPSAALLIANMSRKLV